MSILCIALLTLTGAGQAHDGPHAHNVRRGRPRATVVEAQYEVVTPDDVPEHRAGEMAPYTNQSAMRVGECYQEVPNGFASLGTRGVVIEHDSDVQQPVMIMIEGVPYKVVMEHHEMGPGVQKAQVRLPDGSEDDYAMLANGQTCYAKLPKVLVDPDGKYRWVITYIALRPTDPTEETSQDWTPFTHEGRTVLYLNGALYEADMCAKSVPLVSINRNNRYHWTRRLGNWSPKHCPL